MWPNKSPEPTAVIAFFLFHKIQVAGHRESAVAQLSTLGSMERFRFFRQRLSAFDADIVAKFVLAIRFMRGAEVGCEWFDDCSAAFAFFTLRTLLLHPV